MSRTKRTYNSTSRQLNALTTKNNVLAAAKTLFETKGFEAASIENIATLAKVSIPTVYGLFQSKRGILKALLDSALSEETFQALVKKGYEEKSPIKRLANAATISRQLYDAEKEQIALLRGTSVLSPEFRELELERERRRHQRQEHTVDLLAKDGVLTKTLGIAKVRDILWAFTGRDLYRMMVMERGWTSDEYEKWLGDVLVQLLIDPKLDS